MSFPSLHRILTSTLSLALLADTVGAQSPVGIFDAQTEVGRARGSGSASYDPQRQGYLITGAGQNMWNDRDDFHFVWKRMTGNFILSARARFIGAGVEAHRKLGWTIRPSLETNSAHVTAALHGDGLMSVQFRRTSGGITEEAKSRDSLPGADAVIQLERRDGIYVMSVARFGDTLVTQEFTDVSLPDTAYVGLFVCAHNDTVVERAAFSNVRITTPAKPNLVPYREYIGSNLEILDVATGNATIVHSYRGSFQAPNWTPDGKALIYAQEGRLHRFDLSSRSADVINTGFATRNNNDHVLSFDGRMMGISHHAVEDSGASIIYTLPATGGTPTRVTAKGPSYLHGWSPDGRWLVYTGQRNGELDVYKISATGGDEIRLTSAPGLDDGPEFTPDGAYIYFNSSRSGRMQIWRMRPDGSEQRQITNDGFNNWFPHVSPDGKWIAYLAFPPDVAADDHPFYKHVLVRLMPVGGGPARVIAYVYGGQGTINVPSWSPDGTRLAFVSNSDLEGVRPQPPTVRGAAAYAPRQRLAANARVRSAAGTSLHPLAFWPDHRDEKSPLP
jgi:TolB protein